MGKKLNLSSKLSGKMVKLEVELALEISTLFQFTITYGKSISLFRSTLDGSGSRVKMLFARTWRRVASVGRAALEIA